MIYVLVFWVTGVAAASTAVLVGCLAANAEADVLMQDSGLGLRTLGIGFKEWQAGQFQGLGFGVCVSARASKN